ncbi:MAG: hypothetical protein R3308_10910 [Thiohalobacterales bacterium]|nr:hypothetical protein [Thiohalobacterales bacterium]
MKRFSFFRERGFLTSRQALVLLLLIFLAPTFVIWVMHRTGGEWWPESTTNRGVLVHPARPLELSQDIVMGDRALRDYLQGKWTLVYIGDAACDNICRENLYKTRQIRAAQNENVRRVQRLYIVSSGSFSGETSDFLASEHPKLDTVILTPPQLEQLTGFFTIDETPVPQAGRVYFVDPLGNLMMYYQPDADPSGMLRDLQKLLKYSRIG